MRKFAFQINRATRTDDNSPAFLHAHTIAAQLDDLSGQEPNTLYPYGNLNAAAQSVLAAIDDGPIDLIGYTYQPVILQKLPNIADGDATISQVSVNNGSEIVDANGNLTSLKYRNERSSCWMSRRWMRDHVFRYWRADGSNVRHISLTS